MKISEFRKLIREEVRNIISEVKLDPNKKFYWFEYYPHMSGTYKAEAVITGKTLLLLKKLYDSDEDEAFDRVLKAAAKGKTFYFAEEVFADYWDKLVKALAANKAFADMTEEGSFAMSPNSIAEAKQMVKKIEAQQAEDDMDF